MNEKSLFPEWDEYFEHLDREFTAAAAYPEFDTYIQKLNDEFDAAAANMQWTIDFEPWVGSNDEVEKAETKQRKRRKIKK